MKFSADEIKVNSHQPLSFSFSKMLVIFKKKFVAAVLAVPAVPAMPAVPEVPAVPAVQVVPEENLGQLQIK